MFKFLLCINFFEKIADRETVFMVIFFPTPSGYIQRVLKRKKRLYFRRSKYMLNLQIIVEFRKSLQLVNAADVLCIQHIRMNLQTLVQPFHKQPLCILFYQNHPFRSGIVSVQFTSLPHTSQPGVFCLANSSTLG